MAFLIDDSQIMKCISLIPNVEIGHTVANIEALIVGYHRLGTKFKLLEFPGIQKYTALIGISFDR